MSEPFTFDDYRVIQQVINATGYIEGARPYTKATDEHIDYVKANAPAAVMTLRRQYLNRTDGPIGRAVAEAVARYDSAHRLSSPDWQPQDPYQQRWAWSRFIHAVSVLRTVANDHDSITGENSDNA